MTLKKMIVNCSTGETNIVNLTAQEIAEIDQITAQNVENEAQRQIEAKRIATLKASAKAKLIAGETLTEEEADTLLI